jgi:hypothetical protein
MNNPKKNLEEVNALVDSFVFAGEQDDPNL